MELMNSLHPASNLASSILRVIMQKRERTAQNEINNITQWSQKLVKDSKVWVQEKELLNNKIQALTQDKELLKDENQALTQDKELLAQLMLIHKQEIEKLVAFHFSGLAEREEFIHRGGGGIDRPAEPIGFVRDSGGEQNSEH
jgi:hypothetical protein